MTWNWWCLKERLGFSPNRASADRDPARMAEETRQDLADEHREHRRRARRQEVEAVEIPAINDDMDRPRDRDPHDRAVVPVCPLLDRRQEPRLEEWRHRRAEPFAQADLAGPDPGERRIPRDMGDHVDPSSALRAPSRSVLIAHVTSDADVSGPRPR